MPHPLPHLAPIAKPLLADAVYERLLEGVVSGDLAPGQRLNIDDLAEAFGVSRTPVREALARLEGARLIEVSRNASTTVTAWGVADMVMRAHLLGGLARAAIMQAPARALSTMALDDEPKINSYVTTCRDLVSALDSPIALRTESELSSPLQLFLSAATLERHGLRTECRQMDSALSYLRQALRDGDRHDAASALDDVTSALMSDLGVETSRSSTSVD